MVFRPNNILVINFGQLGDAVLSLPALRFLRERFPNAQITAMAGQPADQVIELSRYTDATIAVDRVALRDGPRLGSTKQILQLVRNVRRRRFDFVIDLHSLYETNLLGFLSGAPVRLFGPRRRRSFDFLSNFKPVPPFEDPSKHAVDRYLDVLTPLGSNGVSRIPLLKISREDDQWALEFLRERGADDRARLVGMFPGAGHPTRRWAVSNFVALAEKLTQKQGAQSVVFVGPEEESFIDEIHQKFSGSTIVASLADISRLGSVLARLDVFVSSSTGPMHLAAAVGTPVVVLYSRLTPDSFTPVGEIHRIVFSKSVADISVDDVYNATIEVLDNKGQAQTA